MTSQIIHTLIFMVLAAITVATTSAIGAYINLRLLNRSKPQPVPDKTIRKPLPKTLQHKTAK